MKLLKNFFLATLLILSVHGFAFSQTTLPHEAVDLIPATRDATACISFNDLNSRIRDRAIGKATARAELNRLLAEIRMEYYQGGGRDYPKQEWVFPLAGYNSSAIAGGRRKGYIARGYDYYSGNRHGGHPSFDIFIRDRNQDSLDDRDNKQVTVLSLTGGIVVALERDWETGSALRGGKYLWIYDPGNDLLLYYAHNDELLVKLGATVKPGDEIAMVGRSGYNAAQKRSPTHLHLTLLRAGSGEMIPVNAYRYLQESKTITSN